MTDRRQPRDLDTLRRLRDDDLITLDEAGLILDYSAATVERMLAAGQLDAQPWGSPRRLPVGAVRRYRAALNRGDRTWPLGKGSAPRKAAAAAGKTKRAGRTSGSPTEATSSKSPPVRPRGRNLLLPNGKRK